MKSAGLVSLALLAAPLSGCGAIFHASQSVEIATAPADKAVVYQSGSELPKTVDGTYETTVFINQTIGGPLVAISGDERLAHVEMEQEASAAAIICDVLWSLTIIGVAAPISDAALGTFVKTASPVEVVFDAESREDNPMPVYVIGGERIAATDAPVAAPAAAPSGDSAGGAVAPPPGVAPAVPPTSPPPPPPPPQR